MHMHRSKARCYVFTVPAMQPWDCRTWWYQREGRYRISPSFTVTSTPRALLKSGYFTRSGSRGFTAIQGTCTCVMQSNYHLTLNMVIEDFNKNLDKVEMVVFYAYDSRVLTLSVSSSSSMWNSSSLSLNFAAW